MKRVNFKKVFFLYLLILISFFGCSGESPTDIPDSDPATGLRFVSTPHTSLYHNDTYFYTVKAVDDDSTGLIYTIEEIPDWLTFIDSTKMLYGKPTADNLGEFSVVIQVSNSTTVIEQSFSINVSLRQVIGEAWYRYSPYKWYHDGKPLDTKYCKIFSDGAHDDVKEIVGELADERLLRLRMFVQVGIDPLVVSAIDLAEINQRGRALRQAVDGGIERGLEAVVRFIGKMERLAADDQMRLDALVCAAEFEHDVVQR